jgi:hypothetical protein
MFSLRRGIPIRHLQMSNGGPYRVANAAIKTGAMEESLLMRFGLCVDPRKQAASGLSKKVKRAFGIGVTGLSESEKRIRKALMEEVLGKAKFYDKSDEAYVLPGFGLHAGFPSELQIQIETSANAVHSVAKKILRGCEYWLADGRIVEPPCELEVFIPREAPEELLQHMPFGPDYLGPGCRIRRAVPVDEPQVAIYEIVIWESWRLFFSILPPEP